MTDTMRVQCRCGAVEIEISAAPIAQFFCHCDDCQAVHGAAFVPESVYPAAAVRIVRGQPSSWTLKRNPRVSCPDCGMRLFIDVLKLELRGINGYLLPQDRFRPSIMCIASSPSGPSSTNCRISNHGRRSLVVRTKPSHGEAKGPACNRRNAGKYRRTPKRGASGMLGFPSP